MPEVRLDNRLSPAAVLGGRYQTRYGLAVPERDPWIGPHVQRAHANRRTPDARRRLRHSRLRSGRHGLRRLRPLLAPSLLGRRDAAGLLAGRSPGAEGVDNVKAAISKHRTE